MMGRKSFLTTGLTVLFMLFGLLGRGGAEDRYVVNPGDTLYAVSKAWGVSIEALKRTNRLKSDQIKPKQVLLIPTAGTPPPVVEEGPPPHDVSRQPEWGMEETRMIHLLRGTAFRTGQEVIVHRRTPDDEEEELGDGGALLALAALDQEETKNPPLETLGKWNTLEERSLLVRVAKTFLGVPYRLGGSTLRGLDCSALVKKIYGIFEISLPRTAREQSGVGKSVQKNELQAGDLVFFTTRRSYAGHVGIYIGEGEFVHASSRQREVKVDHLDAPYFSKRFLRGVRVKELEREI